MNERDFLNDKKELRSGTVDIRKIGNILWYLKYWFLFSIILCISMAYFYIRYTTPLYQKNISIILNNQQDQYSNNYKLISNAIGINTNTQIDNQIFILKSAKLMQRVIERGSFNVRYFSIGRFIEVEEYTSSPLIFSFIPKEGYENDYLDMTVAVTPEGKVHILTLSINNEPVTLKSDVVSLEQIVTIPQGRFSFNARGTTDIKKVTGELHITRSSVEQAAKAFASWLTIFPAAKQADVLMISLTDFNPKRAEDILNLLIEEYNIFSKLYDSQSILATISFLDERLSGLEDELNRVEGTFTDYRSAHELLDINSQSQLVMSSDIQYKARLNELSLQISVLDIIKEYLTNDNVHKLIPANIGISDGSLNSTIEKYNQLVIERDRMLAGSSDNNFKVQNSTNLLNTLKANIAQSVKNLEIAYGIEQKSIRKQLGLNQLELVAMPSKQLALAQMSRLQQVKEPLYILLQQKREEALLMLSSISDYAKVVDGPFGLDTPISSKQKSIYLIALLIALVVPIGIVILINVFRSKVVFEKDIIDRCNIPILGIVPKSSVNKKSGMKISQVTETGRDRLTESFRMLRSKFQYLNINKNKPGASILQISSSGPNEGKSFIAINMALSLAYLGKKILLVGADLRKPSITGYLQLDPASKGLSDFLAGDIEDIHQIISRYKDSDFLDIILSGPIPHNPSELLSHDSFGETLDILRSEYDYIIVDSAPFLSVSDGFIVSKSVDCVLFLVRSGFTKLSNLDTLQNMYNEGNFKSVMIVLNDVDFNKNAHLGLGSHGYGYSYGYGAGYGYAGDYQGEGKRKKKS